MGAYKGTEARYDVVSARVTSAEVIVLQRFARERNLDISSAVRMLLNVGLEFMNGGASYAERSVQGLQD